MHRRTFVKTAASLMAFPLLPNIPEINRVPTIDLLEFCNLEEGYRYHLTAPFIQEETLCATDGAVGLLMGNTGDYANLNEGRHLPDLRNVFDTFWKPDQKWRPWPDADYLESADHWPHGCYRCRRTGVIADRTKCATCDGEGYDYMQPPEAWPYEDEAPECKTCHGTGWSGVICPRCNGNPFDESLPSIQHMDARKVAARYHYAVAKLPGAEFIHETGSPEGPIVFRFDGGRGLLMPVVASKT